MKSIIRILILLVIILLPGCQKDTKSGRQVLLILNSGNAESVKSKHFLIPYLDHFGIPFDTFDLSDHHLPYSIKDYSLVILSHANLCTPDSLYNNKLNSKLVKAMVRGAGIISFDPEFLTKGIDTSVIECVKSLQFVDNNHYITSLHNHSENLNLFDSLSFPVFESTGNNILISANGKPFLWTSLIGNGRIVQWASQDWMETQILGPLGGLDDCLWRSIIWAARKPFVMRGLPPVITMRVDDVAGRGELWQRSPLYWIETANKYGLKPWLGLFIYNLNPAAINELRGYILKGQATAMPHAFGRPPRSGNKSLDVSNYTKKTDHDLYAGFYYNPKAMPLRENDYDEFIYFDHQHFKPWSDEESKRGLEAVDQWYEENKPMPKSTYFVAHWYEAGANVIEHISKKWGMEFIAQNKAIDMPWNDTVPWIKQGPFRLYEKPGTSTNNPSRELRGTNPVYYADFTEIQGIKFFNCFTEIRDVAGYEWSPDNNVEASVDRGIRQLTRAFGGMALAVLFTHETDFIYLIHPEKWEEELKLITKGISKYNPMYMTREESLKIVRATKTSKLEEIQINKRQGTIRTKLSGNSDVKSYFYLFTESGNQIKQQIVEIPEFTDKIEITSNDADF
jgi:hypothetical protein